MNISFISIESRSKNLQAGVHDEINTDMESQLLNILQQCDTATLFKYMSRGLVSVKRQTDLSISHFIF